MITMDRGLHFSAKIYMVNQQKVSTTKRPSQSTEKRRAKEQLLAITNNIIAINDVQAKNVTEETPWHCLGIFL